MAIEDAINALPEHWDDVLAQLGPEKAAELTALAGMLDGDDDKQVLTRIGLLVAGLSARHPVRRALGGGYLLAPAAVDRAAVAAIRRRVTVSVSDELPTAAEILRTVTGRVLAAPAYTEQEVRRFGADPEDPVLIRLEGPDGGRQWPAFQFDAGQTGVFAVVRIINAMLGAAADPIGVADWWLSRNAWLNAQPSLLLGRGADDRLLSAASAVGSVM
jgi:hypothetical protein